MELKCVNSVAKPIEKSATTGEKRKNDPKTHVCVCTCVCVFPFCCSHPSPLEDLLVDLGYSYILGGLMLPPHPHWNINWRSHALMCHPIPGPVFLISGKACDHPPAPSNTHRRYCAPYFWEVLCLPTAPYQLKDF